MRIDPYIHVRTRFDFAYSPKARTVWIDGWLKHALPEDHSDALPQPAPPHAQDPCAQYVARILQLGLLILQLWRVPVFAPARLVRILPQLTRADGYICEVDQPAVDAVPVETYVNAYLLAAELCDWACAKDPSRHEPQDFLALLEQRVKKTLPPYKLGGGSTVPVLRAAHRLGIPFFHMGAGVYQIGTGAKARYLDRSQGEADQFIGVILSGNKAASVRLLRQQGLPVPRHVPVLTRKAALAAAGAIGYPLVVKPLDANRGEGVTVGVDTDASLITAFERARDRARTGDVLIERQAPGVCHRLFIIKGQLLYAVKRLPIFVTGDGLRTLRQIIAAAIEEDQARPHWRRSKIGRFDQSGFADLAARGIDCDAVPDAGERVFLRPIETTEWGGIDEDVTDAVHPLNLKAAVDAVRAFGLEVAGVDMISADIGLPWFENGAIINEVNAGPLLAGGDISRSHLASFLDIYLGGSGCIPVTEAAVAESTEALLAEQAAWLLQDVRRWIVFTDKALGPQGEVLEREGTLADAGFDPRGKPLQVVSSPEALLLLEVLRNRAVDHVVLAKRTAPAPLRHGGQAE